MLGVCKSRVYDIDGKSLLDVGQLQQLRAMGPKRFNCTTIWIADCYYDNEKKNKSKHILKNYCGDRN